jgi:nitrite reductase/ring-hydroxylating ferredoxin subunit
MEGCSVKCPWHGLEWDLKTGECSTIKTRLPTFEVYVEDGSVYIEK